MTTSQTKQYLVARTNKGTPVCGCVHENDFEQDDNWTYYKKDTNWTHFRLVEKPPYWYESAKAYAQLKGDDFEDYEGSSKLISKLGKVFEGIELD